MRYYVVLHLIPLYYIMSCYIKILLYCTMLYYMMYAPLYNILSYYMIFCCILLHQVIVYDMILPSPSSEEAAQGGSSLGGHGRLTEATPWDHRWVL